MIPIERGLEFNWSKCHPLCHSCGRRVIKELVVKEKKKKKSFTALACQLRKGGGKLLRRAGYAEWANKYKVCAEHKRELGSFEMLWFKHLEVWLTTGFTFYSLRRTFVPKCRATQEAGSVPASIFIRESFHIRTVLLVCQVMQWCD